MQSTAGNVGNFLSAGQGYARQKQGQAQRERAAMSDIGSSLSDVGGMLHDKRKEEEGMAAMNAILDKVAPGEIAPDDPIRKDPKAGAMFLKQWTEKQSQQAEFGHDEKMLGARQGFEGGLQKERLSAQDTHQSNYFTGMRENADATSQREREMSELAGSQQAELGGPVDDQFPSVLGESFPAIPYQRDATERDVYGRAQKKPYMQEALKGALGGAKPPTQPRRTIDDDIEKERRLKAEGLGTYAPNAEKVVAPEDADLKRREVEARIAKMEAETAAAKNKRPVDKSLDRQIDLAREKMRAAAETVIPRERAAALAAAEAEWRALIGGSTAPAQGGSDPPPQMPPNPADATDEQLKAYSEWKARNPGK